MNKLQTLLMWSIDVAASREYVRDATQNCQERVETFAQYIPCVQESIWKNCDKDYNTFH